MNNKCDGARSKKERRRSVSEEKVIKTAVKADQIMENFYGVLSIK